MTTPRLLLAAALAAVAPAADAAAADAPADARWVSGSRVNLRREPQPGAAVVALLTTNTRVQLTGRSGTWCAVRTVPEVGEPAAGHVACELLASAPLKLEDVEAEWAAVAPRDGQPSSAPAKAQDLAARAFWIAPSLGRWERYAQGVPTTPAPADTFSGPPPRVVPNSEYDAMKALIAAGRMKVDRPPAPIAPGPLYSPEGAADRALQRAPLPAAQPSFFGPADFDAPVPSGWTLGNGDPVPKGGDAADASPYAWAATSPDLRVFDALSHRFGAALKATPTSTWGYDRVEQLEGVGGVGSLAIELAPAGAIETVARDGRVAELPVASASFSWGGGCCFRGGVQILKPARPGGAPNMDAFLVAWVGRKPPAERATVASRALDGKTRYDKLVIHTVDLDGDRKADFVVYEGRYQPEVSATGLWQAVYANVAGKWRLVYRDADDDCT